MDDQNASPTSQTEKGFIQRWIDIYFSPQAAYESIDRKPDWVIPLLVVAIIAAIMTQIWWLLLIPLIALAEGAGLYMSSIFPRVLKDRDAEIARLRQELGAVQA